WNVDRPWQLRLAVWQLAHFSGYRQALLEHGKLAKSCHVDIAKPLAGALLLRWWRRRSINVDGCWLECEVRWHGCQHPASRIKQLCLPRQLHMVALLRS